MDGTHNKRAEEYTERLGMEELGLPLDLDVTIPQLQTIPEDSSAQGHPPSFAQSQFDVILRRQVFRQVSGGGGLKLTTAPSRFLNLSNEFEFAGWGHVSYLELTPQDLYVGEKEIREEKNEPVLGEWMASAVAANDVLGSVFYALPPLFATSHAYSPISLLIATFTLFLWRPIIEELTSALPLHGANYAYLINVGSKSFALGAASLTLLDYSSTVVVSAASASAYIAGEVSLPFPVFVGTLLLAALPVVISLCGVKESARTAFGILALHGVTMSALILASLVAWARSGSDQLRNNWLSEEATSAQIIHQIFDGVCIGMLGLTGFECTPDYVRSVKNGGFPKLLRNIHVPTILLNAPLMLLIIAILPAETISSGSNVLSILAEHVGGRWLRIWVVVDAVVVLSAGVLTGILSACALLEQLGRDRIIPKVFLRRLPFTDSQGFAIAAFVALSGVLYASTGANLSIISAMFAITWLSVMSLFPMSVLLLKFNRGRLPRRPQTSLFLVFCTIAVSVVVFAGNVAINPVAVGYFAIYSIAILVFFLVTQNKIRLLRCIYWCYDQTPLLHKWSGMKRQGDAVIRMFRNLRKRPVCVLAKTDEIHQLSTMIAYVHRNEATSCLKLVHFYGSVDQIPSELEANAKLLDEMYPDLTIDLVFVQAPFKAEILAALSHRLDIPRSLMFMNCPGSECPAGIAELGTRIIAL